MVGDVLSGFAVGVSIIGIGVGWRASRSSSRSAAAADRSARAAEATDRRQRAPTFAFLLDHPGGGDRIIYRVRNDGPQDLEHVLMYRPKPPDRITYPLAVTGRGDWVDDEVELGPLRMGEEAKVTLCCGVAKTLPQFRVRIACSAGEDRWEGVLVLPSPRGDATGRAVYSGGGRLT